MRKVPAILGSFLFIIFFLPYPVVMAQPNVTGTAKPTAQFELQDGDRVVFVGNSLFENDLPYNYLELALTTRWPNRHVTFRNIGWTGDTVWGEARSYISSPSAYDLLLQQLTKAQPTVVFVAYGSIEAQAGEEGLSHFEEGLTKLLAKIDQLGAKAVLLSPIPVIAAETPEKTAQRNAMLETYAAAIAKKASAGGKLYLDIFKPLQQISQKEKITDNGVHLNETGYYYLATTLENSLGLPSRNNSAIINLSKKASEANAPVKILSAGLDKNVLRFTLDENYLPLPQPVNSVTDQAPTLKITGLKKGIYALTANNIPVATASASDWKKGVIISQGATVNQVNQLRNFIFKKNELYFQQYRPQNRTYILGFRAHEQGRHAKGLEDLNIIITWLEGQIALNRVPQSIIYQLTPIK